MFRVSDQLVALGLLLPVAAAAQPYLPGGQVVCSCGRVHAGPCPRFVRSTDAATVATSESGEPPIAGFQINTRWATTATDGDINGEQGDPVTLTWGIVEERTRVSLGDVNNGRSRLVEFLDNNVGTADDLMTTDLEQKSWFSLLDAAVERWESISGLTFNYEPNDDGRRSPGNEGILGRRADVRLAGADHPNPMASPLGLGLIGPPGDVILYTDNVDFFSDPTDNFRGLRDVISHEVGHALGFRHVVSSDTFQLMNDRFNPVVDGPQLDDIRQAQRNYGDALERGDGNDTLATASLASVDRFGAWSIGTDADYTDRSTIIRSDQTDFISIDSQTDTDTFRIDPTSGGLLDFRLRPVGPTYTVVDGVSETPVVTNAQSRLTLTLLDAGENEIGRVEAQTRGEGIEFSDLPVAAGEAVYARINGLDDGLQFYRLDVASNPAVNPGSRFAQVGPPPAGPVGTATLQADGVALTVTAEAAGDALLAVDEDGFGVDGAGAGIDGGAGERLLLSFDQTVTLENLELAGLDVGGVEQAVLSFVSGVNPFEGLEGYNEGPYELTNSALSFSSPEWQSDRINFVFGVDDQAPLLIEAGTVLALSSNEAIDGGFTLASVTANAVAVPEPAAAFLSGVAIACALWRREKKQPAA